MRRQKLLVIFVGAAMAAFFLLSDSSALAKESKDIQELKKQIEVLQQRVDELEAQNDPSSRVPPHRFQGVVWDPFERINQVQEEMDQAFQSSFERSGGNQGVFSSSISYVSSDLKETADGYEMQFEMTGLDEDAIDIEVHGHSMTVKGEYSREDKKEDDRQYFSSQSFSSFMNTIPLPEDADTTKIKKEKKGDTLIIRLPKKGK